MNDKQANDAADENISTAITMSSPAIDQAMAELDLEHGALLADLNACRQWMPLHEWYLKQLGELETAQEKIKEHGKELLKQIAARERALAWKWGAEFQAEINQALAERGGKKKSIDTHYGRAGYRTLPARTTIIIEDEAKAIEALDATYPELLVKVINKIALNDHIRQTGEEIPGLRIEAIGATERFYPDITAALPANPSIKEPDNGH